MTSIDFKTDIERIIAILKNDTTLKTDINDRIEFGESDGLKYGGTTPRIFVTVPSRPFVTRDQLGIGEGSTDPQSSVQYLIKIVAQGHDTEDVEQKLYPLIKQVVDILKANPRLKHPAADNDPRCIRSFVFDMPLDVNLRGTERLIATVGIQCQIGSSYQVTLPGAYELDLLSITNSPEGFNFDENFLEDQTRIVDPTTERTSLFLEYENTSANETKIRSLLGTSDDITLAKPGSSRTIRVAFIEANATPRFDEIERSILHVEKTL